jgi:hypothetical protein
MFEHVYERLPLCYEQIFYLLNRTDQFNWDSGLKEPHVGSLNSPLSSLPSLIPPPLIPALPVLSLVLTATCATSMAPFR